MKMGYANHLNDWAKEHGGVEGSSVSVAAAVSAEMPCV